MTDHDQDHDQKMTGYQEYLEQSSAPTIYEAKGYIDRDHYLESLADGFEVDTKIVKSIAALLGPSEDFDGLVSELTDICDWRNI